jgi:putative ABC transport system substrate-binding protein
VALVGFSPQEDTVEQFREGLREAGYSEGRDVVVEIRSTEGRHDAISAMIEEVVRSKPDVIVVENTRTVLAAKRATNTIPVVIAVAADPVRSGAVESLSRPGGNITGLSMMIPELSAKRFQLLREAIPSMRRLGVLRDPSTPWHPDAVEDLTALTRSNGMQLTVVSAHAPSQLTEAFLSLKQSSVEALYVLDSAFFSTQRATILRMAAESRLPVTYGSKEWAERGALLSYSADFGDMFRRAAGYVDRILKGAKPAELPIEQPTKFDLIINLKTAQALGKKVPESLLLQASEVIK